jgi:hypothetical protein
VDWYGCEGNTYAVREGGGEECGIAQWGRKWEVDVFPFYFTSRGELVGVSDVGVAITVTNVRGWRRRHLVLGHGRHVALALARVSR